MIVQQGHAHTNKQRAATDGAVASRTGRRARPGPGSRASPWGPRAGHSESRPAGRLGPACVRVRAPDFLRVCARAQALLGGGGGGLLCADDVGNRVPAQVLIR